MNTFRDRWIAFPGLLLLVYFLFRLVDYGKVIFFHPLSNIKHDFYSYAPLLYFLKECGFHQWCSFWYNGFTTFVAAPPGWYFFTYPFYIVTGHLRLAYYLSLVLIYVFMALVVLIGGKKIGMSPLQRITFFAFFVGNNVMINTLRLGRAPELFAWVFFLAAFFILYYFKDRPLTPHFYWIILPYTLVIFTYHSLAILLSFFVLGFFLVHYRHFWKIVSVVFASFLLSAFWWFPLILRLDQLWLTHNPIGVESWWMFTDFLHFTSLGVIFLPLITFLTFFFYYRSSGDRNDLFFFGPILFLLLLFFLGVLPFIPVFRHIFTNIFFALMIFLILVFVFSLDYRKFSFLSDRAIISLFFLAVSLTIFIGTFSSPLFDTPTKEQNDVLRALREAESPYMIVGSLSSLHSHRSAFYSYGALEFNLSTVEGHYPAEKDAPYLDGLTLLHRSFLEGDCRTFLHLTHSYGVRSYISYGEACEVLEECGLPYRTSFGEACLYRVPS